MIFLNLCWLDAIRLSGLVILPIFYIFSKHSFEVRPKFIYMM